jgi:hypothetical protein
LLDHLPSSDGIPTAPEKLLAQYEPARRRQAQATAATNSLAQSGRVAKVSVATEPFLTSRLSRLD